MTNQIRPVAWGFAVLACLLVLVLAVLPPFVGPGLRHALILGFDLTCHQIPERSFQIGGIPFALCHRCTGVVVGLVLGSAALISFWKNDAGFEQHARLILGLSVLPLVVDWGVDALGIWANVPFTRFATGIIFGIAAGYAFARALALRHPTSQALPAPASRPSHSTSMVHAQ